LEHNWNIAFSSPTARLPHLHTFFLPAYAPELKPVKCAWSYLKMNPLANRPAFEIGQLAAMAH